MIKNLFVLIVIFVNSIERNQCNQDVISKLLLGHSPSDEIFATIRTGLSKLQLSESCNNRLNQIKNGLELGHLEAHRCKLTLRD